MGSRTNTAVWVEKERRWKINVQKDGQRRSFYSSTPGRNGQREANAKADAWLDSRLELPPKTVKEAFDQYVQSLQVSTTKGNWDKILSMQRVWFADISRKRFAKMTEQDWQDIIDQAHAKGLSKKTLSNMVSIIRAFLKFCRKKRWTQEFYENLTVPKGARLKGKTILQPDDLRKLFSCEQSLINRKLRFEPYVYAFRFEVVTGLRPGEILGLQWEDVHGDYLDIRRSINRNGEVTQGKNENALRRVYLSEQAAVLLEQQRALTAELDSVFGISNQQHYYKSWKRFCTTNEITAISPYELRHTFVSVSQVLSEGEVKQVVGHSRNMDTFGIYGHEFADGRREIARKISDEFHAILADQDKTANGF